jgi:hypothetical protein
VPETSATKTLIFRWLGKFPPRNLDQIVEIFDQSVESFSSIRSGAFQNRYGDLDQISHPARRLDKPGGPEYDLDARRTQREEH